MASFKTKKKRPSANHLTIYEARTRFSEILRKVGEGQEFIIANGHRPVARLVPLEAPAKDRKPGLAAGKFVVSDDFDAPMPPEWVKHFK